MTEEQQEEMKQLKNNCVKDILSFLENNTKILELDFVKYNLVRNLIRYNINRLLNQWFRVSGVEATVKLRREQECDGNRA